MLHLLHRIIYPEEGQGTVEYVLVILAAAAIALSLIAWILSSWASRFASSLCAYSLASPFPFLSSPSLAVFVWIYRVTLGRDP